MEGNDDNVFTQHVLQLDRNVTEIPPSVKKKLAVRLRTQLRRRGLLDCSASTFDYSGRRIGDPEVFDELLSDAYLHLFYGIGKNSGKQLAFLRGQVKAGNSIDPLIHDRLKLYVHDLHRNAFPQSVGIHKNVTAAAKRLHEDPEKDVEIVGGTADNVDAHSILGTSASGPDLVEAMALVDCIKSAQVWEGVLKIVQRCTQAATNGTVRGITAIIDGGHHPFVLRTLEQAIDELAYEPAENAPMSSEVDFADDDPVFPEFVRTILDEERYEARQAKVDEFVDEGGAAILGSGYEDRIKEVLLDILRCLAERCRHCDPKKRISQADVRRDLGLPKQTMSDYMKKLKAALETTRS